MGRQTNFYMTIDDEIRFFEYLISSPEVIVFRGDRIPEPEEVPLRSVEEFRGADRSHLYIRNRSFSPAPKFHEMKHGFWVDSSNDEIVEWMRGSVVDGRLNSGRIYISTARLCADDSGGYEWKSEKFLKWFGSLQRWIRRHADRYDKRWGQVMPGAAEFVGNGGYLR